MYNNNKGGGGANYPSGNGYGMPPQALPASTFVQSTSSSLAAAAAIGSSWESVGWRAPVGAMWAFVDHMHNIQPLEPLPVLDPNLPAELQMKEVIQKVQVS